MDSGSEYVESDEDVPLHRASEEERERGGQVEDDDEEVEVDPRELMTSPPPPASSSQRQRQRQYQPQHRLTSSPSQAVRSQGHDRINHLSPTKDSSTIVPSILPTDTDAETYTHNYDYAHAQGINASTYFTRPNRFFGAPATWQSWTRAERDLATAIDRARATDLSLHLCGAFALRSELAGGVRGDRRGRRGEMDKGKGKAKARDGDGGGVDVDAGIDGDQDESRNGRHGDEDGDDERLNQAAAQISEGSYSLPKSWTAWPMPVHQVPRDELLPRLGVDGEYRARPDMRPSAALEESLIAIATRFARERWNRRVLQEAEDGEEKDVDGAQNRFDEDDDDDAKDQEQEEGQATEQEEDEEPDYPMFTSQPYASPPPSSPPPRRSSSPSNAAISLRLKNERNASPSPSTSSSAASHRPVPLADDTQARELFLPSARHILTKLDDLLLALHKARAAYAGKPVGKPRGRSASQSQSASASVSRTRERTDNTQGRGRRNSRGRLPSLRRQASSRNDDADGEDEDDEDYDNAQSSPMSRPQSRARRRGSSAEVTGLSIPSTPQHKPSSHTRQKRKRSQGIENVKLQLRDWSDVVGTAALAGWDPAIVQRASERCARLFGENMLFRTFHEGDGGKARPDLAQRRDEKSGNRSWYTEQLARDDESSDDSAATTSEREGEDGRTGGRVPARKIRVSACCLHCVAAKTRCVPSKVDRDDDENEHGTVGVKSEKEHSTPHNGRVACRRCTEQQLECSGIVVQSLKTDSDDDSKPQQFHERACPHKRCARHEVPFRKMYHLQRHLDTMHSGNRTSGRSSGRGDMVVGRDGHGVIDDDLDIDTDMAMDMDMEGHYTTPNSTHDLNITIPSRDTIVCPVLACKRHQMPFARGAKLYVHVKRMHPDVDVEALKKLETSRRGERRGRPSDKGSRSQSLKQSRSRNHSTPTRTTRPGSRRSASAVKVEIEISDDSEE